MPYPNALRLTPEQFERLNPYEKKTIEFQLEHCPSCQHYNAKKGDFKETKSEDINHNMWLGLVENCRFHDVDTPCLIPDYKPLGDCRCFFYREWNIKDDVYGKRVRLTREYCKDDEFLAAVKSGIIKFTSDKTGMPVEFIFPSNSIRTLLSAGSLGIIKEVPYSPDFDYEVVWPVEFDAKKGTSIGVSPRTLVFVGENGEDMALDKVFTREVHFKFSSSRNNVQSYVAGMKS